METRRIQVFAHPATLACTETLGVAQPVYTAMKARFQLPKPPHVRNHRGRSKRTRRRLGRPPPPEKKAPRARGGGAEEGAAWGDEAVTARASWEVLREGNHTRARWEDRNVDEQ